MHLNRALKASTLLFSLSLAACVAPTTPDTNEHATPATASETAPQPAAQTTAASNPVVTENFGRGGGSWEGTGSVIFRYTAIERDGEIHICGAFTGRGTSVIRRLSREVMRQAKVTANGETLRRNLLFFTEASNATFSDQMVGVETRCGTTGKPAGSVPLNAIRVDTRDGKYRIRL